MVRDWCKMARDLRTWDEDCVDELCDIVFGEFLLGNFAQGVPRDPVWDVITHILKARTGRIFAKGRLWTGFIVFKGGIAKWWEFVGIQGMGVGIY